MAAAAAAVAALLTLRKDPVVNAAGYVRVSTKRQEREGLSLAEQRSRVAGECERRGWQLAAIVTDAETGKSMRRRGDFLALLDQLDQGVYGALVVTHIDRIARSLADFLPVLERSSRHGWELVVLDGTIAVDTSTPMGKAMAQMAGVFAELHGALISQRTREGLAFARARGTFRPGEHCRYDEPGTIRRIVAWADRGVSGHEIARRLNLEGVPAPSRLVHGEIVRGEWQPRTVNRIIRRERQAA